MVEKNNTTHRSFASVPTDSAKRFAKQLASHLGRKTDDAETSKKRVEVLQEGEGTRLVLLFGSCLLIPRDDVLELHATAPDAAGLQKVEDVVGSHLERFGQRQELSVNWNPAA